jgi:hypothetical protein
MHLRLLQMKQRRTELLGAGLGIGQRVCDECNEAWPLTEEFFQAFPNGRNTYFLYACRVCAAARRRNPNRTSESPKEAMQNNLNNSTLAL